MPSFDVLRVEPDGSTVIAGKAEPGTTIDIMNGETVIASAQVGSSGDFVAILDAPLAPGDYQLTLRTGGEGGAVRLSEEVATISIPQDGSGELLAMVTRPGKASRIIAQPSAPVEPSTEVAAAGPAVEVAPPADEPAAPAVAAEAAPTGTSAAPDVVPNDAAAPGVLTPELPASSALLTTTAPEIAIAAAPADAPQGGSQAPAEAATDVAVAAPGTTAEAVSDPDIPGDAMVRVDAVEIEGDRIFIAGSATPGYPVRVSANGVVIGTEKADETGRFIVEAVSALAVGDHTINADLMDPGGQTVVLRAAVPFTRPEGEAMAAVAPASADSKAPVEAKAEMTAAPAELASSGELILPDIASLSQMREDAFAALTALEQMVSTAEAPDAAAIAAAQADVIGKLRAAAMASLPADAPDEMKAMAQSMQAQAQAALSTIEPMASDGQAGAIVAGDVTAMREMLKQAQSALSEPAEMAVAVANAPAPSAVEPAVSAGEPKTIVQAPLASSPGAVIIRRGDTLWQISRRTYGQGVRYTTIYLANRSQIQDPDRIQPGQVFSVPETPLENAEELHRQRIEADR